MINTELYRIFYYAATHKNISKAADALYISQPAVSKSIKKLESLTSCVLFARSSKGVSLTSEGEILFKYISEAFKNIESGEMLIEKMNRLEEGAVKIGISNTLCKYYFLPILEKFHEKYPNIKIQIINSPSPKTYLLLEEWKIDFGIISIPKDKLCYNYTELMDVHDIFVSSGKPEEDDKTMLLSELSKMHLMLLEKDNQTRIYIDDFLTENKISVNPEIQMGSMDFLIEFAKIGIGTACVIKEFVQNELENGTLFELPVTPKIRPRKVGIVQKENIPLSLASKTFIQFICESKNEI